MAYMVTNYVTPPLALITNSLSLIVFARMYRAKQQVINRNMYSHDNWHGARLSPQVRQGSAWVRVPLRPSGLPRDSCSYEDRLEIHPRGCSIFFFFFFSYSTFSPSPVRVFFSVGTSAIDLNLTLSRQPSHTQRRRTVSSRKKMYNLVVVVVVVNTTMRYNNLNTVFTVLLL